MADDTKDLLKDVPDQGDEPEIRRAWMTAVAGANGVGEAIRYGGLAGTPMTIEILGTDDRMRVVRFEEERDAEKHGTLRAELIRQGSVRAEHITNAKVAGDFYYVMTTLAQVVGGSHPLDEMREWISGYRLEAKRLPFSLAKGDLHDTLDALRRFPYSKRAISLWMAAMERQAGDQVLPPPRPPLIVDPNGGEWTSISHLATYIRWGRDQAGVVSNDTLGGRIVELGGRRWTAQAWDVTTRLRQHKITTVLVQFPPEDEGDDDDAEGGE